jgi:hypothetical protein
MRASRVVGLAAVAAVLLLAVAGWLGIRAVDARRHLLAAKAAARQVEHALLSGDPAAARQGLAVIQREARLAHAATSGPVWWAARQVPYAGRTPRTITDLVAALDDLARTALPDLVQAGSHLNPDSVRMRGTDVSLGPLLAGRAPLTQAAAALHAVRLSLDRLPTAGVLGPVARARTEVVDEIRTFDDEVSRASTVARLAPDMLGAHGPRRYLLALQNNAESRGTGGLMGAWGILTADNGRVRLTRLGSDEDLRPTGSDLAALGPAYAHLYGADPGLWSNANESPHFPYAARLWLSMWKSKTGETLDGVVATDPVALSYLLGVAGPVTLQDGTRITAGNAVATVEQQAYARFDGNGPRKHWLLHLSRSVFNAVSVRHLDRRALLDALGRGVDEHRLLAYSAHPQEENELATTPLAGLLASGDRPFVALVVDNAGGNKLDYYLHRRVDYALAPCRAGVRQSSVTVRLTNAAPAGRLPAYVTVRADHFHGADQAANRLLVYLFLTPGSVVRYVTVDGQYAGVLTGTERGHPVVEMPVELDRGQARQIVVHLEEPAYRRQPVVPVQPLVVPQVTRVTGAGCG